MKTSLIHMFGRFVLVPLALMLGAGAVSADLGPEEDEGWVVITEPLSPAPVYLYGSPPESVEPMGAPSGTPPPGISTNPLITETARALGGDPARLYEFVRNRVAYVPYFGLLKGADRTLLDRTGNDLDQAALLCSLLRAAGYNAQIAQSTNCTIPLSSADGYDAPHWLGVPTDVARVRDTLFFVGITNSYDPAQQTFTLNRFWVALGTNGAWHHIDPAFKPCQLTNSLSISCNISNLLSDAGGTATADYVSNLSYSAISSHLGEETTNLVAWFRQQHPVSSAREVLPHWEPVPETVTNLSGIALHFTTGAVALAEGVTNDVRTTLSVIVDGVWTNTSWLDEVASHKLWISFTNHPGYYPNVRVWSDDTLLKAESSPCGNSNASVRVRIRHPYGSIDRKGDYLLLRAAGNAAVVPIGFGGDAAGRLKGVALKELEKLSGSSLSTNDDRLTSAALWATAAAYLQGMDLAGRLTTWRSGYALTRFHAIGILAQADNFYLDLKTVTHALRGTFSLSDTRHRAFGGSALEHAVIEQLQGQTSGVSTIRVLARANELGKKNYLITLSNSNLLSQFTNYTPSTIATIRGALASGLRFLLPQDGQIPLGQWAGYAYCQYAPTAFSSVFMVIGGGLHGGYCVAPARISPPRVRTVNISSILPPVQIPRPVSRDPVDLGTGSFLGDSTDLTLDGPFPIAFSRHYRSDTRNRKGPLGWGWTHGYDVRAVVHTDILAGMGDRTPEDMAAAVTAANYLWALAGSESVRDQVVEALIANWMVDQLNDNAVSITLGQQALTFIRQPDGSYSPPPGVGMSLARNGGLFTLTQRNGPVYSFNASNRIDRITDPDSNYVAFAYNADTNLTSVTSSFGSSITLSYTSNLVTGVSDSAGRSLSYQYDAGGNLTNCVDPEGFKWAIAYDSAHQIVSLTDPEGIMTISNRYNALGQVTNQISATGESWNQYSAAGVRGAEEDPGGRVTEYLYDDYGRTTRHRAADGATTWTGYDGQNHATNTVDPDGVTNRFVYDTHHNVLQSIEAWGTALARTNNFAYDSLHRLAFATNAQGKVTSYQYNAAHHPTSVSDPLGVTVQMGYADRGLMTSRSVAQGGQTLVSETRTYKTTSGQLESLTATDAGTSYFTFDARGDLCVATDPKGHSSTNWYDKRRLVTTNANALGQMVRRTYGSNRLLRTVIDPRGAVVSNTWTKAYKPQAVYLPDGGMASNVYDSADRLVYQRDARGFWNTNRLDAVGRVTNSLSTYANTRIAYDIMGRATSTVDAVSAEVVAHYDLLGRAEAARDPLGKWTWSAFDSLDRLLRATNALGRVSSLEYDDAGRMLAAVHPSTAREDYTYDGLGRLRLFTDADAHLMRFGFDAQGRPTAVTNGESEVTVMRYDLAGLCTGRWDAASGWTRFQYDAADRLTTTVFSDASSILASYDAGGNVTNAVRGTVTERFAYDALNRLTNTATQVGSVSFAVGCQYDLNGNLTRLTYPDGRFVSYGYDEEDRLKAVTDTYSRVYSFDWDAGGRLTGIHYPNGVNGGFTNDLADRATSFSFVKGATAIATRRIAYDDIGNRMREEIDAGLPPVAMTNAWLQHTYDLADRVVSSTGMSNGDRVTIAYAYDASGNMTNRVWVDADIPAASFTNAFSYALDGLVTSCVLGTSSVSFVHDAAGVRVKESRAAGTRHFAVNPADPFKRMLAELNSAGAVVRSYIWAGSQLLAMVESNGTPHYAHADVQGSVLALTDSAGCVTDEFAYGPYGELCARNGTNDLAFTWLGGSGVRQLGGGLYATQHRLYDANLKRFIQSDPKGIAGGLNLYAYGNLNPLVYIDPLGLCAESGGIRSFPGNDFGLNTLLAKDRMRNDNPRRFYEVYGNDRDVQIETALNLMLNIALMAFDVPAGLGTTRALTTARGSASAARIAGGRGLLGIVRPGGLVQPSMMASYSSLAQSARFSRSVTRYNSFARRFKLTEMASVAEIRSALATDTTFARTSNLRAGLFGPGEHAGSSRFWMQGNPTSLYGPRAARHEMVHLGAALRGQGDEFLHEIGVQWATTPENLAIGGSILGGSAAYVGHSIYQWTR